MALSDLISIVVSKTNPGITAPGFGIPLYPSYSATWAERTRSYKTLSAVGTDFATTTVEYQMANAAFAQSPSPQSIMFGRCANKPTATWTIGVATVVAAQAYKIRIRNLNVNSTATYTAQVSTTWTLSTAYVVGNVVTNDTGKLYICTVAGTSAGSGGPTGTGLAITDGGVTWNYVGAGSTGVTSNDAIMEGLRLAYNALSITTFTAALSGSSGSKLLVLTSAAAGNWIGIEVYDALVNGVGGLLTLLEGGSDPGVSADLTAIANESGNWYEFNMPFKSNTIALAAATWIEANQRLMLVSSADSVCATHALSGATDTIANIMSAARARTACEFHPRNDEFLDVCIAARFLPIAPGRDNWRAKTLSGPTPVALTATMVTNILAKQAGWYYVMGATGGTGVNIIGGQGTVSDNEYIDVIRGLDWYTINLQVDLVNLEIQNEKIPYTQQGIDKVEGVFRARNEIAITAGVIRNDPPPTYTFPTSLSVATADRAARLLQGVATTFYLAGAINNIAATVQVLT